jgi:serine/threonine protein phosphatase PrpC
MEYFARSDVGLKRTDNEDCYYARLIRRKDGEEVGIIIVADGVGGAEKGEFASCLTSKLVGEYIYKNIPDGSVLSINVREIVQKAIEMANTRIREEINKMPGKGMGTTLVAALVRNREILVANVGDSRAYYLFGSKMRQITKDHSLVQEFVDSGQLSPEDAQRHPQRNIITRAIGTADNVQIDFYTYELPGDNPLLVLCTDGLHGMVDMNSFYSPEFDQMPLDTLSQILINKANEAGGLDNITVAVTRPLQKSGKIPYPPIMPRELDMQSIEPQPRLVEAEKPVRSKSTVKQKAIAMGSGAIVIILLVAFLFSGIIYHKLSTGTNSKEPVIGLSMALNHTMENINGSPNKTQYYLFPVLTDNLTGAQCAWSGPDVGNCTKWRFHFEAIKQSGNNYSKETITIFVFKKNGIIRFENETELSPEFDNNSLMDRKLDIENRSLANYLKKDSREIFNIFKISTNATTQGQPVFINITLNLNAIKYPSRPVWMIDWIYKDKIDRTQKENIYYIDAINGTLLE